MIPFILELICAWMDAAEHRRRAHISRAQQISARSDGARAFSKTAIRSGAFLTRSRSARYPGRLRHIRRSERRLPSA
jgi:hypothetical protein